jgi:hypothetical protein
MESLLHAAVGRWLARFLLRDPSEFLRHKMFRVPKLPRSAVGNTRQRAPAWRSPVSRKNRFPYDKHSHLLVRVMHKELLCCGRPPQTTRSSWGQQQYHPWHVRTRVKDSNKVAQIREREYCEWFLTGRDRRWPPEIHTSQKQCGCYNRDDYRSLLHFQNRSAMTAPISCGKRIIPDTTTTAAQSRTLPSSLPRTAHCLARCCCQNPKPSKTTDSPKSQGRSVVTKALAAPAPSAAANPTGRQQLIVAAELKIAANEAETPVPCFTVVPLVGLGVPLGEPSP